MDLPDSRDTVLHFFEQMKKAFPELRNFYARDNGDLVLEGDKEQSTHRWLAHRATPACARAISIPRPWMTRFASTSWYSIWPRTS